MHGPGAIELMKLMREDADAGAAPVAVITGGGRGLGLAIAGRLAKDGFDLVLAGPDAAEIDRAARELGMIGRRVAGVPADVSRDASVDDLFDQALCEFGKVDVLINNAAVAGPTAPVAGLDRVQWDEVLAVNLTGAMLCCRAALPAMMGRRSGRIVNIASVAGKIAYPLRAPYAVSKWGLIGLTMTLAKEAGPYNIQVNAVCPGPVEGERMRQVIRDRAVALDRPEEEVRREYAQAAALGRMVRAQDVADLVAFLASPSGENITGQAIDVSAGYGL
jgi:NAD(P)-dependent dehydrogenase (short-subunit alcohol dehydrogenase family)